MGYNTRYSLSVQLMIGSKVAKLLDDSPLKEVIAELRTFSEEAKYCLGEDGETEERGKWYEHQKELTAFSARWLNFLFTLHGEGEENEDLWNKYFINGKMQVEKAVFQIAPFDWKKLK